MRILLSNDDGIHAPGIQHLAAALRQFAFVQIIAPDRDRSGASNALTLDAPLRPHVQPNGDIAIVSGTPTDCVYLGVNALMCPGPDIVVSGINAGPNLGDDVLYSGTVAAAMEGRYLDYPALAISLNGKYHYATAAAVTCRLLRSLTSEPLWTGKIFNINVPDLPLAKLKGFKVSRCGRRQAATEVIQQNDPRGQEILWIGPPGASFDKGPDTDFDAIEKDFVSITPLQVDLTANAVLPLLSSWLGNTEVDAPW